MQKKQHFFFSFGCPNLRRGGGVNLVGTKDQIFRQIQFEGSPKYQRFGCMFRVVICVLKDEEQIRHLVLPCWQSMVFREATQWREAQVGGKVANSTSRYKPAIINLWSPWPPSFVKPDTHLERKFGKNCNAMLPEMKRGKFSRMTIKSEYSQKDDITADGRRRRWYWLGKLMTEDSWCLPTWRDLSEGSN